MQTLETTGHEDRDLIARARLDAARLGNGEHHATKTAMPEFRGYDLIAELGSGGQGVVYEAVQRTTGRRVALKVMRGGPAAGSDRRHRFEREIKLLARLDHPSLVTVHDSGEQDGWFYSVMEFVEGTPIDAFVHDGALGTRATLELFARVCDSVHAAHQKGVIHRDLKPANILVDAVGKPHVLDFGLAKLASEEEGATSVTDDGQILGTMPWASPEQVQGRSDDIDVRTDVYSLGVVLYELLTGRLPYETSGSIREALENIIEARPLPPSQQDRSLRGDVETIVLKCLAKERDRRYGTIAEVAAEVRRCLAGEAIDARRDSPLYVLGKTLQRYRVPLLIGVASMVAGIAFGVVMTGMYQQAERQRGEAVVEVQELREELKQLKKQLVSPQNWRTTFASADKLRKMDPGEGLALIRMAWAEAHADESARQQMLKAVNAARLASFVQVMDLGMRDPSPKVQEWAIQYLGEAALRNFVIDFAAYDAWYEQSKDLSLEQIQDRAAQSFTELVRETNADGRAALFEAGQPGAMLGRAREVAARTVKYGLPELVVGAVHEASDKEVIRSIGEALAWMDMDEAFLRARIIPLLEHENVDVTRQAVRILQRHKATFAIDDLVAILKKRYADSRGVGDLLGIPGALGEIGDPRVIPLMIAMIAGDDTYDTVYGIGYVGLGKLTGVQYDESHDGAWWRAWWSKNHQRFAAVAHVEIPELEVTRPSSPGRSEAPSRDAAETVPEQSLMAGGDPKMRYFLYGPKVRTSKRPRSLLLVMPGGDGSAAFRPFVTDIWRQTATDDMLVAQLVAPQWSADQLDRVVWPTTGLPGDGARFTTETFVSSVVNDIDARYDVDRSRVWILAWSSSGPAAYASLLHGPATGAFVAMSVFKPDQLGDLSRAAGKNVYILHSPEDGMIPMSFPKSARDTFSAQGATSVLETYTGGHGWHGDVFTMIRGGLSWLDEQAPEN